MTSRFSGLFFALFGVVLLHRVSAWGSLGHRTVAYLAEMYLTEQGATYTSNLLENEDISDAALWADELKFHHCAGWQFTRPWHFIDAKDSPPSQCGVSYDRDCGGDGCVVGAIVNQTARINDADLSDAQRGFALRFLLHFIGDIHQPLHTEAIARGGNELFVTFDHRHNVELHAVWDKYIPEKHAKVRGDAEQDDAKAWAKQLFKQPAEAEPLVRECLDSSKAEECALTWAGEANAWICKYVLGYQEGDNLGEAYYDGAVPIVDDLIGKAGARLGAWINALAAQNAALIAEGTLTEQGKTFKKKLRRRRMAGDFACPNPNA